MGIAGLTVSGTDTGVEVNRASVPGGAVVDYSDDALTVLTGPNNKLNHDIP